MFKDHNDLYSLTEQKRLMDCQTSAAHLGLSPQQAASCCFERNSY